jgi:hypothetical protein
MRRILAFIKKVVMVNYMGNRYLITGQKPSKEERQRYL